VIDETVEVASVDSAFDAHDEWPEVVACFAQEVEIAVSNTGDSGFEFSRKDAAHDFSSSTVPGSFPAKVLALLFARYRQSGRPMIFLPTELMSGNGRRLAQIVSNLADESRQPDPFR
jgi:tagaturonate reductase